MNYELDPQIVRVIPFQNEGGAVAAVDVAFGPLIISTKLYQSNSAAGGFFLSFPSRRSESQDKWYDQVTVTDPALKMKARTKAISEYERLSRGELVAV